LLQDKAKNADIASPIAIGMVSVFDESIVVKDYKQNQEVIFWPLPALKSSHCLL